MRIGISILASSGQNIWNNGLWQNIFHLVRCLGALPMVSKVVLVNCGDVDEHPAGLDELGQSVELVWQNDATDLIDIAIEMGGALDPEWIRRFRARGGKVVFHPCGQPYAALIESTIFTRQGFFGEPERCDEVWLLPKDAKFAAMIRTVHRCPVHIAPYLWAPIFLELTAVTMQGDFGYRSGMITPGSVQPAIFEPNLSPIKMGLIPMQICDVAERLSPGLVAKVHFMNGDKSLNQRTFIAFMQNSCLYQAGKNIIAARDFFAHVMARGANLVVSHQLDCEQNYLYLDALYGGYPLIHNSPMFRDVGYYYDASDVGAGAQALLRAVATHDRDFDLYMKNARSVISSLSPCARPNLDAYARMLIALTNKSERARQA